MKSRSKKFLLVFLPVFFTIDGVQTLASPGQMNFADYMRKIELDTALIPIRGSSPTLGSEDLRIFSDLGNLKIIGLGEATHGTKEFFEMKHRIFKYFVTNLRARAFGFECDFGESIYLDRYITGGEGDLKTLMSQKMRFWTWHTEEVKALLEWMRTYNEGLAEEKKLHYLGFDCQYTVFQSALLREYIRKFSPEIPADIESALVAVETFDSVYQTALSMQQRDNLIAKVAAVGRFLAEHELIAKPALGRLDYEFAKQLIRTAAQAIEVSYAYFQNLTSPRDAYMAENALWLQKLFPEGGPLVAWAHNGHVANDPVYSGMGSMGFHLRQELGTDYRIVGFSFCRGNFMAIGYDLLTKKYTGLLNHTITEDPPKNSYNELLTRAWRKNFILRFDRLNPRGVLIPWLNTPRAFLRIGAVYTGLLSSFYAKMNLWTQYDMIVHFDSTNAAVQLSRD